MLSVVELTQLARTHAELAETAGALRVADVALTILSGPLAGVFHPRGTGSLLVEVLAATADLDRADHRRRIHAGQQAAAKRGNRVGRPPVLDDAMFAEARELRALGVPVPEIAHRVVITTGKNARRHPSLASVYRALTAEPAATGDDDGPAVWCSDNCSAAGRFEIGSLTRTMTGAVLASLAEVDLRTSPVGPRGVDHDYFTVGFQLLGLVLEIADGTPFPELLRHRLFDPLGMRHSGVRGDDESATLAGHVRGVPTAPPASAGPKDPRATSVTTAAPAAVGRTGVDGAPRRFVLSPYGCAWTAAMRGRSPSRNTATMRWL